jgi:hypothetical protein
MIQHTIISPPPYRGAVGLLITHLYVLMERDWNIVKNNQAKNEMSHNKRIQ